MSEGVEAADVPPTAIDGWSEAECRETSGPAAPGGIATGKADGVRAAESALTSTQDETMMKLDEPGRKDRSSAGPQTAYLSNIIHALYGAHL